MALANPGAQRSERLLEMDTVESSNDPPTWQLRQRPGSAVLSISGSWLVCAGPVRAPELIRLCSRTSVRRLSFDVSRLDQWDTLLVAFLWEVKQTALAAGVVVDDATLPSSARNLLRLLPATRGSARAARAPSGSIFASIGQTTLEVFAAVGATARLAATLVCAYGRLLLGRARLRSTDLLTDLLDAGPRAIGVVGVINFLVGAILAYVGAEELRPFGVLSYVPSLVAVASVREISSLMTAMVMAGRTGGAYAARIASMRGDDEVAALESLGIPLGEFLLLPAAGSLMVMLPILYLFGCFLAVFGGMAVSTLSLGFSASSYLSATFQAVPLGDFAFGAGKSIAFAALIGVVSCRMGLTASRSAAGVGKAATSAVVANIVGIILIDAVFAAIAGAYSS